MYIMLNWVDDHIRPNIIDAISARLTLLSLLNP